MIGRLYGKLLHKNPPHLLLDVNGVGYELEASMNAFYKLPELGQMMTLHTHLIIREDAHLLFGFFDEAERKLFRTLIKVNGIGPKLAMTILSSMEPEGFVQAVHAQDISSLTRIPGVGKKTAERIVIEMKDRLKDWHADAMPVMTMPLISDAGFSPVNDAVSALVALGYKPQEAHQAVRKIAKPEMTSELLIRQALQQMMK